MESNNLKPRDMPRALWVTICLCILATIWGAASLWAIDKTGAIPAVFVSFTSLAMVLIPYFYYRNTGNKHRAIIFGAVIFILLQILAFFAPVLYMLFFQPSPF